MKVTAQNAHGAFRKLYAPTMVLLNAAEGTLTSYGTAVNGNTTEVDRFAHDFPESRAAIYAATGDDFRAAMPAMQRSSSTGSTRERASARSRRRLRVHGLGGSWQPARPICWSTCRH